jgi:uncharacterized protein
MMSYPLPRNQVRLLDGPMKVRQDLNAQYLLQLDADRLLHNFRVNARIPSNAKPLGGWENPTCGLRGHFTGHYLSACAATYAATGNDAFLTRLDELLIGLQTCQSALGEGYLSAFPETEFDTLESKFAGVWAPYYTLHKILAGLVDTYQDAGRTSALAMAIDLGDWIARRLKQLDDSTLEPMLRTDLFNPSNEYGGIGTSLYDLYSLTGEARYLAAAHIFDRDWFLNPLADHDDQLAGLHANTHIPQAIAAARRYELTGDLRSRKAVEYFWQQTALHRSYINGGSSGPRPDHKERSEGGEHWPNAGQMGGTLTTKINESCVVHNMLRLTDAVTCWSDDPRYSDFRETVSLNSVPGTQHPKSPGAYIYSHPLSGGSRKVYGDADNTFWCCYGTGVEAFARLTDGIYFTDGDTLHVRQFVPSEATWTERGVRIVQTTNFPYEQRTTLTIHLSAPSVFSISLRMPGWAKNAKCTLNGESIASASIRRTWKDGDVIELTLPMSLRTQPLPGDPTMHAFVYGPVVLAARTPHSPELGLPASKASTLVVATDIHKLQFEVTLVSGTVVSLVPLSEIVDEAYGVYFKTPQES